jgi:hypothetical protein
MMTPYKIVEVDRDLAYDVEQLGTKRKFWYRSPDAGGTRWLFKAEERSTGEDWAEKVACEICELLGIPHVHYELAVEAATNTPGVVCPNIARAPLTLVLGNQLLFERDPSYPTSEIKKYGVRQHTIGAVNSAISKLRLPPNEFCKSLPIGIDSAAGVFVGYVMLDALIANQDRHHQNWGALRTLTDGTMLAPTFDHGASLARNEPEEKRMRRLRGQDPRYSVENFAKKASSSMYSDQDSERPLSTLEAFRKLAKHHPKSAEVWLEQLFRLSTDSLTSIVNRIPSHRMSPITREFTLQLMDSNRRRLLGDL